MNQFERRSILLSTVSAAILAAAFVGAKRGKVVQPVALASTDPEFQAPAIRAIVSQPELPVIYEARIESSGRAQHLPWLITVAAMIVAIAAFALWQRPELTVAAPASVVAGSEVSIAYDATGNGAIDVSLDSGGYRRVQRLEARQGAIVLPRALTHAGHDIVATLRMRGFFGSDAQILRIPVTPALTPITRVLPSDAPVIRAFTLSKTAARGGEQIVASYETNAPAGLLQLVDSTGAVWLSRLVRGHGTASLNVPLTHADTPFIVVVEAQRGRKTVRASAGFVALALPAAASKMTAGAPSVDEPVFTLPPVLHGGATLAIKVPGKFGHATVALSSPDGTIVSAPAEQTSGVILLRVPRMNLRQRVFATLTYQSGKFKETLIRHAIISP